MADTVDAAKRSLMMAGIRSKDTKPELALRRALHALGFRYILHPADLPGRPDMVFRGPRAVVLVNGCFWHGHECHLFRLPATRPEFWRAKIDRNRKRDQTVRLQLQEPGWRVLTVWECAIRGRSALGLPEVVNQAALWIRSGVGHHEIRGRT